nr:reverse transcriptase domain, reverse transcriptase zinc-binding domain protein [Tanacetum cinerariifolium]
MECNLSASSLNDSEDVWIWSLGNNHFSVKDARCHIDEALLPDNGYETSRKGIEVSTIICPLCNNGVDNSYHTMWVCSLATTVWIRVFKWLDLPPPFVSNLRELYYWLEDLQMSSKKKDIIEVISGVVLWSLWNFHNETIFGPDLPKQEDTHPSVDTSLNHEEDDLEIDEPQSDIVPIRRSTRIRHAPDSMCLYIDAEEHELGDLGEPV